jgi:hypothetical protein
MEKLPWSQASALLIAVLLIAGGAIGLIAGLVRDERRRQREELARPDYSVGRDVYRDRRGITR